MVYINPKSLCNSCGEDKYRCEFLLNQPETEDDYTIKCENYKPEEE